MVVAAADLLAEERRARLSAAEIITRAGVSTREFHSAFGGLEDCLLAAFDEGLRRLRQTLAAETPAGASMLVKIEIGLCALLTFLDEEPGWARILLIELPLQASRRRENARRELVQQLSQIHLGTLLDPDPPLSSAAAEHLSSEVLNIIVAAMREREPQPLLSLAPWLMASLIEPELTWQDGLTHRGSVCRPPSAQVRSAYTGRAARVLRAVARNPGASNRQIAHITGQSNEGNASLLLAHLAGEGLIRNLAGESTPGQPNAWVLTPDGESAIEAPRRAPERASRAA